MGKFYQSYAKIQSCAIDIQIQVRRHTALSCDGSGYSLHELKQRHLENGWDCLEPRYGVGSEPNLSIIKLGLDWKQTCTDRILGLIGGLGFPRMHLLSCQSFTKTLLVWNQVIPIPSYLKNIKGYFPSRNRKPLALNLCNHEKLLNTHIAAKLFSF